MHSLKNTIIAVGLLGLSFLFYQASSTNKSDQTDLIPALEITEGVEDSGQLSANDSAAGGSALGRLPNVEMPDFGKPGQTGSDLAPHTAVNEATSGFPGNDVGTGFPVNSFSGSTSKNGKANNLDGGFPDLPFEQPAPRSGNLSPPPIASTNQPISEKTLPPASPSNFQRQPLDNIARDKGLINSLKNQNLQNNSFASENSEDADSYPKTPFASQPIPSSDSSFNQTAADRDSGGSSQFEGVVRADSEPDFASLTFQAAWPQVDKFVAEENYQSALRLLSRYYRSTQLTGPQRQRLIGWLDALAGKVIFSAEHHLQSTPYTVSNESLEDIGKRWQVPAQLIFNINQTNIPVISAIAPGTPLKSVQGPFDAEIDLNKKIMTLFLNDLYAGRFPIQVGISGSPRPGEFQVLVKSPMGHNWRDSEGNEYSPGTPENGYGPNWIGLSGSLCIHAVPDSTTDGHHGCIGLNEKDAEDVFAILAEGSTVTITR